MSTKSNMSVNLVRLLVCNINVNAVSATMTAVKETVNNNIYAFQRIKIHCSNRRSIERFLQFLKNGFRWGYPLFNTKAKIMYWYALVKNNVVFSQHVITSSSDSAGFTGVYLNKNELNPCKTTNFFIKSEKTWKWNLKTSQTHTHTYRFLLEIF